MLLNCISKLGHPLEEIRIRALNNIISKLDYGAITELDLILNNEFINKILDWLTNFDAGPQKETVLRLIGRVYSKGTHGITSPYIQEKVLYTLQSIQSNIESSLNSLLSNVIEIVAESVARDGREQLGTVQPNEGYSSTISRTASQNGETNTSPVSEGAHETSGPLSTREMHHSHKQYQHQAFFKERDQIHVTSEYPTCFPHLLLPWQPLIATDRHVLKAVEDSLKLKKDPALILHSCYFFNDVILQDFPAEVFVQRPSIVQSFLSYIDLSQPGNSRRICTVVMKCLSKLTAALHVRIYFYSDACIANLKQETCLMYASRESSVSAAPSSQSSAHGLVGAGDYLRSYSNISQTTQSPQFSSNQTSQLGSNSESDGEDSILLQLQQLNLPQYCLLSLYEIVPHLRYATLDATDLIGAMSCALELTNLLTVCVTSDIWHCSDVISIEIAGHIKHVLSLLGQSVESHQGKDSHSEMHRRLYLQLLALTRRFLVSLIPVDRSDEVIPNILKKVLASVIFDYPVALFFPSLHVDILSYVKKFSGHYYDDILHTYNETVTVNESMAAAVKLLKAAGDIGEHDVFSVMNNAFPSLAFHMDLNFVNKCVDISVHRMHRHFCDDSSSKIATQILVRLLAHCEHDVQLEMYKSCHQHVLAILGVDHVKSFRNASQLSFLYNTSILTEVVCHGLSNCDKRIQQNAEEMIIHLLKGKFLMPEVIWLRFLENLIPVLPLLQCYCHKSTVLGQVVAKMFDPDVSSSIFLPQFEVLKGNLRLLFCADPLSREEAISRLMWLLSKEVRTEEKLPSLSAVHGTVLNTLCIVERPTKLDKYKLPQTFYEASVLYQFVESLMSTTVEPKMKLTTLTQISIMLHDKNLHSLFIEQHGVDIALDIFHKALIAQNYQTYPDSVIPIITILKNIAQSNSRERQRLSLQPSLYYCIIRSIFLYCNDNRVRHDGSQLLFLLLYNDLIISIPEQHSEASGRGSAWSSVSLPEVVIKCMRVPFMCHAHWRTSHHTETTMRGVLMNDVACQRMLKLSWNIAWYEGVSTILAWQSLPPSQHFSPTLQMNISDINFLKTTSIQYCCQQHLFGIQNATSHHSVNSAIWNLTGYLKLYILASGQTRKINKASDGFICWDKQEWEKTLVRFLKTPPSSNEDEDLLVNILQCVRLYLKIREGKNCSWISKILKDPDQPLPKLLKFNDNGGDTAPHKELCKEVLFLIKEYVVMEKKWFEAGAECDNKKFPWTHFMQILSQNLKFSDTEHFYNLSFLDWMLMCLANLSGFVGWSVRTTNVTQLWKELIISLIELVNAFHCGKAGAGAASFLGLSITRSSILCMNHLLCEMQENMGAKGWEEVWLSALEIRSDTNLAWLTSLWQSRDPVTRAGAVQLAAGLCTTKAGCNRFLTELNIWASGISLLLDHNEACLVREQAAILLTNLSSHGAANSLSPSHISIKQRDMTVSGTQALKALLKQTNFFGEMGVLVSRLYVGTTMDLGGYMVTVDNGQWTVESLSGRQLAPGGDLKPNEYILVYNKNLESGAPNSLTASFRTESISSSTNHEELDPHVLTTPTLVKSVCWLLVNLLILIPEEVVENVVELGLLRSLFQCLHEIPKYSDKGPTSMMYMDILELNESICAFLAKCLTLSEACGETLLHMHDTLYTLLSLLNPAPYSSHLPYLVYLRNRLWTSLFKLLTQLLRGDDDRGYETVRDTLFRCGYKPFLATVQVSMEDDSFSDLVNSTLASLTSLLNQEMRVDMSEDSTRSLQNLLDSPRGVILNHKENASRDQGAHDGKQNEILSQGSELCRLLLRLYEVHRLQQDVGNLTKAKIAVISALTALLGLSQESKYHALSEGLVEMVIVQLRDIHVRLTIETVECLQRISGKKHVCPALREVGLYFSLLTNFMSECIEVKQTAAEMGLADLVHKLWVWCNAVPSLLHVMLKMMCTFTADCEGSCQSLVLTSTVAGVGLRKTATSISVIHAVFGLVNKEMDATFQNYNMKTLTLAFQLLKHACVAQECRLVINKGNLFHSLPKLHPVHAKKQKHWEKVSVIWLEFLLDFTSYPDGQLALPKVQDAMDVLLALANPLHVETRFSSLQVLRNISFHQSNRSRLLASGEFMQLLQSLLNIGSMEEKYIIATIVWAIIANNQKAKLIMKCSGIDIKLQEIQSQLRVSVKDSSDKRTRMLSYIVSILRNEDPKEKRKYIKAPVDKEYESVLYYY